LVNYAQTLHTLLCYTSIPGKIPTITLSIMLDLHVAQSWCMLCLAGLEYDMAQTDEIASYIIDHTFTSFAMV